MDIFQSRPHFPPNTHAFQKLIDKRDLWSKNFELVAKGSENNLFIAFEIKDWINFFLISSPCKKTVFQPLNFLYWSKIWRV